MGWGMHTTLPTLVGGVRRSIEVVDISAVLGSSQVSSDEGRGRAKASRNKNQGTKMKEQKIVVIVDQKSRSNGQE